MTLTNFGPLITNGTLYELSTGVSQAGQAPAAADIKNKDKLVSYNHTVIIYIYLHTFFK